MKNNMSAKCLLFLKNKYSLSFSHLLTPTILLRLNAFQLDVFTKQLFLFVNRDMFLLITTAKLTFNTKERKIFEIKNVILITVYIKNVFLTQLPKLTAYRKLSHKIVLYLMVGGIAQITPIKIIRFQFRGNYFPHFRVITLRVFYGISFRFFLPKHDLREKTWSLIG